MTIIIAFGFHVGCCRHRAAQDGFQLNRAAVGISNAKVGGMWFDVISNNAIPGDVNAGTAFNW